LNERRRRKNEDEKETKRERGRETEEKIYKEYTLQGRKGREREKGEKK